MFAIEYLLGKSVTIDSCHVGYATELSIEQADGSFPQITIKVNTTMNKICNIDEYSMMASIVEGEPTTAARMRKQK